MLELSLYSSGNAVVSISMSGHEPTRQGPASYTTLSDRGQSPLSRHFHFFYLNDVHGYAIRYLCCCAEILTPESPKPSYRSHWTLCPSRTGSQVPWV